MADNGQGANLPQSIWQNELTLDLLHEAHRDTMVEHLGIEFLEIGLDWLGARMPADHRTFQPYRIVHGGASVVLAETMGSVGAAWSVDQSRFRAVGQEVNANHLRPVSEGWVTGLARPIHRGRRSQVWGMELFNEEGKQTCIARLTVAIVGIVPD